MSKGKGYNEGDKVEWDWGNGTGSGKIKSVYTQKRTVKIKGEDITRDASKDEPAYLIETGDSEVLKSHSEVRKAS
ncbi:MAG TPA: DUF2945 domain-containing protein [Henriciella marina]|uniref:DUF2945 domain-containing protein n=1 Tax=Henriciella sp. TaxID=1968823 RepID=UPI001847A35B|nr:DUF2945 domain-containing protein [Henriciella sp.]HIG23626.1 DUF2945 domain-containing protein [Henriciella sp.]HIK63996.1 DUF2945 domain-containing protein [Henriciella marina]